MGAYSGLIYIFVNYYDVEARCAYFTNARVLIKMTSTSQQYEVTPSTFQVEQVILFSYITNILTKNYRMSLH